MQGYKIAALSNEVIDQQDDESFSTWEDISYYWPHDLDQPDIGVQFSKEACLTEVSGVPRFPIDSAENTLASSIYFMMNSEKLFSKEASQDIANKLSEYMDAWGVSIPEELMRDLSMMEKEASYRSEPEEEYIPEDNQPRLSVSDNAERAIELREEVMSGIDHPDRDSYLSKMAEFKSRLDWDSPESIIRDLTQVDTATDMNAGWGAYYPEPYESIAQGIEADPMSVFEKKADYSSIDWDGLSEVMDNDIIDQIKDDPDTIIPTLPMHYKNIVDSFRR